MRCPRLWTTARAASYLSRIEYKVHLLRKIALEIVVNEDFLDRTIETLVRVARTSSEGNIGDGKIFVLPLTESIAIDSLERGPSAV